MLITSSQEGSVTVARQLVEYVGRGLSFRRSGTNSEIVSARPSPPSAHQLVIVSIDIMDRDAHYERPVQSWFYAEFALSPAIHDTLRKGYKFDKYTLNIL